MEGIDDCGENQICNNTIGSYECPCREGFVTTDDGKCVEEGVCVCVCV